MTPAQKRLIDRLDAIASANRNDVLNMGDEPVPEITWGELDNIGCAAQEAAAALRAALDEQDAAEHRANVYRTAIIAARPAVFHPSSRATTTATISRIAPRNADRSPSGDHDLTGPEQRILDALAWLEGVDNQEPELAAIAFLAGYTVGGGAFNNPRGKLRGRGYVEYLAGDRMRLTAAGRALAQSPDIALTSAELHRRVLERLPGPEQRLLVPLLRAHPAPMTNEALAQAAGYTAGAGAFNNPRGRLRSLGLVEYPQPGHVVAKAMLFLEA